MNEKDDKSVEVRRILEERARLLARATEEEIIDDSLQIVVVALEKERYGIEIQDVSEIQLLERLTPIPGTPPFWLGLVNLRSTLLPLLDLRSYLGLTPFPLKGHENEPINRKGKATYQSTESKSNLPDGEILVVNHSRFQIGLLVDRVIGVRELSLSELNAPLQEARLVKGEIIKGLTPDLITVINLEILLSDQDLILQEELV